eukprot:4380156-Prymnesium_polylepis.2
MRLVARHGLWLDEAVMRATRRGSDDPYTEPQVGYQRQTVCHAVPTFAGQHEVLQPSLERVKRVQQPLSRELGRNAGSKHLDWIGFHAASTVEAAAEAAARAVDDRQSQHVSEQRSTDHPISTGRSTKGRSTRDVERILPWVADGRCCRQR